MALKQFLSKQEQIVKAIPKKLAEWIDIELKETETLWLFNNEGIIYSQYSEEAENVVRRAYNYKTICKEMEINPDFHKEVETMTNNAETIEQEMQCESIILMEIGCWSSSWDLYDSINLSSKNKTECVKKKYNDKTIIQKLNLLENIISLNIYQKPLVIFRNLNQQIDSNLTTEKLWTFITPLVETKQVTALVLNSLNKDFLCAGYGNYDCDNQIKGTICCWSLKNILHPKRFLQCPCNVLCIDFSDVETYKLACGLSDGVVMVFDVQYNRQLWDSRSFNLYHFGPIWAVRWKRMTDSRTSLNPSLTSQEKLLTLSEDGNVCVWELDENQPMRKKTILNLKLDHLNQEISFTEPLTKSNPLWDFDFKEKILSSYFVSTGKGSVNLCSSLNTNKCKKEYLGHQGPVYKIRISPFVSFIFLTCGADWTIKLWSEKSNHSNSLLSLQSGINPVYDISWSPHSSTIFASVSPSRLDIWDINNNLLEPILIEKTKWREIFTSVLFSKTSNTVFVGTDVGKIYAYAIIGSANCQDIVLTAIINNLEHNRKQTIN